MTDRPVGEGRNGQTEQDPWNGRGLVELLADIRSGSISPDAIDAETRRECVEHLLAEGITGSEIARLLHVSDRTIRRDIKQIRRQHALDTSPETVQEIFGNFMLQTTIAVERIRRIARERDVPPAVRIEAERAVCQIESDRIVRLQSAGFLPVAAQRLQADLTHRVEAVDDLDAIAIELDRVTAIEGLPPEETQELAKIRRVANTARQIERGTPDADPNPENTDDENSD